MVRSPSPPASMGQPPNVSRCRSARCAAVGIRSTTRSNARCRPSVSPTCGRLRFRPSSGCPPTLNWDMPMPADSGTLDTVRSVTQSGYKWGFETDIEMDVAPKGLSADTIRLISEHKQEPPWMLEWRLKAYQAWLGMEEPHWARVEHPRIDYQDIHYYAAPKKKAGPKSL